jgi:hypothetical protein
MLFSVFTYTNEKNDDDTDSLNKGVTVAKKVTASCAAKTLC